MLGSPPSGFAPGGLIVPHDWRSCPIFITYHEETLLICILREGERNTALKTSIH
jgi:hypothetical protein